MLRNVKTVVLDAILINSRNPLSRTDESGRPALWAEVAVENHLALPGKQTSQWNGYLCKFVTAMSVHVNTHCTAQPVAMVTEN